MIPEFLSQEFHICFFPALVRRRLRQGEKERVFFSPPIEFPVSFALCLILAVVGISVGITRASIIGWTVGGLGMAGILALLFKDGSWRRIPASYDDFLPGVFFCFVILGASAGLYVGVAQSSLLIGLLVGAPGLLAGYLLGIFAGLWLQCLGWLAPMLDGLAKLAALGMVCGDLVMLWGGLFW